MVTNEVRRLPTQAEVRSCFPALNDDFAYLENAGGSQVPGVVADAMRRHMLTNYVQLGAGYLQSLHATETVADAHVFAEELMGGPRSSVVLGPSTTALCHILAEAYGRKLEAGDEVVISEAAHESNAGPWERLSERGIRVVVWKLDKERQGMSLDGLRSVLSERTKVVAFPHVSNLLGEVDDVRAITDLAHAAGAQVVCDGVAYAPHAAVDVATWGVDWYVFSLYKVYGPHMAALYGSKQAFEGLEGPNHFFIDRGAIPAKWELGGCSHEGCAGLLGLRSYLAFLAGGAYEGRATVERAFGVMNALESPMHDRLVTYLGAKRGVRIVGNPVTGIVSFVHETKSSPEIVSETDRRKIGIRYGNMYAWRLCEALDLDPLPGVVRVSMLHYNTMAEIDRLIQVFEEVL